MFCGNCGSSIDPNGRFCPACGAPVVRPEDETVCLTEEPAYQPPVQPAYQQPAYQPPVQPAYQQPAYQPPVQPAYQQPAYQQPVQPAYEQPAYQQPVQPAYQQPVQQPAEPSSTYWKPAPAAYKEMTWKQFYEAYVTSKWVTWTVVICFITAGLSLILSLALELEGGFLDLAVYTSMGILLLVTKHWAFSLASTIYGGIWSLVSIAQGGTPSGAFAIFAGIMCTVTLIKARKAYKVYRETHEIPNDL